MKTHSYPPEHFLSYVLSLQWSCDHYDVTCTTHVINDPAFIVGEGQ